MSLDTAMARIAQLNTLLVGPGAGRLTPPLAGPPPPPPAAPATTTTTTGTPSSDGFAQMLRTASVTGTTPSAPVGVAVGVVPVTEALGTTAAGAVAPAAAP